MKVERIPFGFPVNKTIEVNIADIEDIKTQDFTNQNIRIKITLDQLLKKSFNQMELAREIKEATHANKLKLVFNYTALSSERSKEIASQNNITDKFKKYAELNDIKYKDTLISKIEDIQNNLFISQFTPNDSFTLESLSLRGAIGIKDGIGQDEFNIDFTSYDEGIIAMIAANGSGKSSIIENCHPYPRMLTRSGSLKDHFCLKDSWRKLIYRTGSGQRYKIEMLIDGAAKCIGTRYYAFKEINGIWDPIKAVDGTNESYCEWVNSMFGTIDLFMRTSFFANKQIKNIPDLSYATKSEKMTLFSTLAGTDYLATVSEMAKKRLDDETKIVEEIKSQLKDFDDVESTLENNKRLVEIDNAKIEKTQKLMDIDKQELELLTEEQQKFLAAASAYDILRTTLNSRYIDVQDQDKLISQTEIAITDLEEQMKDIEMYKGQIDWYTENMQRRKELEKTLSDARDLMDKDQAALDKCIIESTSINKKLSTVENDIYKIELEIKSLKNAIPETDGTCPVCGAPLEKHKKEELEKDKNDILKRIKYDEEKLADLNEYKKEYSTQVSKYNVEELRKTIASDKLGIQSISNDIATIDAYAERIDIDEAKNIVNNSESTHAALLKEHQTYINNRKKYTDEIKELESKMNNMPEDHSDAIKRLSSGIEEATETIATLKAEVTMLKNEISKFDGFEDKIKQINADIKEHKQNILEYTVIQKAFGNNGIQAIELDSAAPEISDIANSILYETYGDRFTISFDTQRETKDNRKIDDFIINIFDQKSGRIKKLDMLSSGEGTWIKQALYFAFSVIRTRRTGFCFKTRFLDESDGALDPDSRIKYLNMIESAHKACDATQTILITHSQELKEIINQKIEL